MFAPILAFVTKELRAVLTRKLAVYGLMAAAALIGLFAAAYLLAAVHALLADSVGDVAASLIVAGVLLAAAGGCALSASMIGRAPRPSASPASTADRAVARAKFDRARRLTGWAAGVAGSAGAGLAAARLALRFTRRERG